MGSAAAWTTLNRLTAAWCTAGILFLLAAQPLLYALTAFLVLPFALAYAFAGIVLLVWSGVRVWRTRGSPAALVSLAVVPSFAVLAWLAGPSLMRAGDHLAFRLHFARVESRYEKLVSALTRGEATACEGERGSLCTASDGTEYLYEPGPPLRLAFPRPGGLLDNWEGVIYDPTGSVQAAQGWSFASGRQAFTAPDSVRGLFGGDIVACERIRDSFYRCWFT